jgi:hypothetical protein
MRHERQMPFVAIPVFFLTLFAVQSITEMPRLARQWPARDGQGASCKPTQETWPLANQRKRHSLLQTNARDYAVTTTAYAAARSLQRVLPLLGRPEPVGGLFCFRTRNGMLRIRHVSWGRCDMEGDSATSVGLGSRRHNLLPHGILHDTGSVRLLRRAHGMGVRRA